jgi:serine O-acetyltransferase
MQNNEQRMNTLCQRLSLLDPTFKKQQTEQQPYSEEELKIIEEVRRECESQTRQSKS